MKNRRDILMPASVVCINFRTTLRSRKQLRICSARLGITETVFLNRLIHLAYHGGPDLDSCLNSAVAGEEKLL